MSEADVTFVIDGNDAGLTAAVSRGVRSLRRLDDEMDEVRASTAQADSAMRGFAGSTDKGAKGAQGFTLSAEKMGQGLSLVSPRLGELTAKIGGLGAAGGPLVAAGAGAVAFGAAWAGVVVSMVDAVRNIDDLTEALTEQQRVALDPYIDNIEALRDVFDSIGGSLTETEIRLLSGFANGVSEIAAAVSLLANAFNRLDDASRGGLSDWIGRMLAGQNPLVAYAAAYGSAVTPGTGAATPGMGPLVDEPAAPGTTFNMEEDARRRAAERARGGNTASNRAAGGDDGFALFSAQWDAAVAAQQAAYDEGFALFSAQWDAQVEYAQKSQDAIVEAGRRSVLAQAAQQEYLREVEAARMTQREEREWQLADALIALTYGVADAAISALSQNLAAQATSAREAWEIQQATALATALINVPASILTGLSQGGPALAAVNGVLAGIQFAAIAAARPPQYHVGGYAPDEVPSGGMTLRDTERTAVVTPAGQQYLTPAMLAAINSGAMNRAETPPIYLLVDGVAQRARRLATNPGTGYSTSGGRRG